MSEDNASLDNNGGNGEKNNSGVATLPIFAEQLEGSLKSDVEVSQYLSSYKDKTISDFVRDSYTLGKTHKELQGELEKRVKIPGENATPEDLTAYRKALGIPETPEGYEVKRPENMPEGVPYDEALEGKFKETAHKLNLNPTQVQGLLDMFNAYGIDGYTQVTKLIAENKEKAVNALKDIWKGDAYETNKTKTVRTFFETLKKFEPPASLGKAEDIAKEFDQSGFGDNPVIVWYFSKLYDLMGDDSFIQGSSSGQPKSQAGVLNFPSMDKK